MFSMKLQLYKGLKLDKTYFMWQLLDFWGKKKSGPKFKEVGVKFYGEWKHDMLLFFEWSYISIKLLSKKNFFSFVFFGLDLILAFLAETILTSHGLKLCFFLFCSRLDIYENPLY